MAAKVDRNRTKFMLDEKDIPTKWYNIQADFKTPAPPVLHPGTKQPIGPADLAPALPHGADQAGGQPRALDRDPRRDSQRLPAVAAVAAVPGAASGEGARHAGAHLLQVRGREPGRQPQAEHRHRAGVLQQEGKGHAAQPPRPGAGQWGSALALACQMFGLQCKVYMVKVSYQQKPYRRIMMETWGAQVVASPSPDTQSGKKVLEQDPNSPGSLGIAISEAVEDAATRDDTKYSLGSVLNHVLMHQTDHRARGQEAAREGRRCGGHRHRLRRRRLELRRPVVPLRRRQAHRQEQEGPDHRRRAGRLPEPHQGLATSTTSATRSA